VVPVAIALVVVVVAVQVIVALVVALVVIPLVANIACDDMPVTHSSHLFSRRRDWLITLRYSVSFYS